MGFSIHYRSTESMHPARAFEIKQHADRLISGYMWVSCEPVLLQQLTEGFLAGQSKPIFCPAEVDSSGVDFADLPDGTVLTLAEVLCVLSREHDVDWDIGHDYEPEPIGRICDGVADQDLMEQLETFGSIGDLLDDMLEDDMLEDDDADRQGNEIGFIDDHAGDDHAGDDHAGDDHAGDEDRDDEEPRVLKFPGSS